MRLESIEFILTFLAEIGTIHGVGYVLYEPKTFARVKANIVLSLTLLETVSKDSKIIKSVGSWREALNSSFIHVFLFKAKIFVWRVIIVILCLCSITKKTNSSGMCMFCILSQEDNRIC